MRIPVTIRFLFILVLSFAYVIWPVSVSEAQTPETDLPDGYNLIDEDLGVKLFRKDYPQGSPDFVQVIDLSQGASVKLMHGELAEPRKGKGMFGGDDVRFGYQTLSYFWSQAVAQDDKSFCVFNGQFFYMPESPTRLAMPLKVDGKLVTSGFGYPQYEGELRMLELWSTEAKISNLTQRALEASSAPNIIGGLSEVANKRAKYSVGRTFVGVTDRNFRGKYETLLVLNTLSATQEHAASALRGWGAAEVMMLDGGGSAQLYCRDGWLVESERFIPQALAVIAGSGPPFIAEFESIPSWSVVVSMQAANLTFQVSNRGANTWKPAEVQLGIWRLPWKTLEVVDLPHEVLPGESVELGWPADAFYRDGIYDLEVQMIHHGDAFPGEPVPYSLIVIPSEMESKRSDLEMEVDSWSAQPDGDVATKALAWMDEQIDPVQEPLATPYEKQDLSVQSVNVIWVPVLMLPFVLFLVLLLGRTRQVG